MNKNIKKVLYISPDGMLEPLGDSQVLKYLEKLSANFSIILVSYEKSVDLSNLRKLEEIKSRCKASNIEWKYKKYRQEIFIASQAYNILNFIFFPLFVMMRHKISLIHIRSYMPGLCIPLLSIIFRFKFIFDMRGFWADEKHDRLGWKKESAKYIFFKKLEKYLLKRADAIVTLTHGSKKYINQHFKKPLRQIFVIRTCVDFKEFKLPNKPLEKNGLVIGYLGTIDTAYDFDKFLLLIKDLRKYNDSMEIHFLTKASRSQIEPYLIKNGLADLKYSNQYLGRDELSEAIVKFDILAFCLKSNFSILASMPTKIGESLACGIPILCNPFNEDIVQIIEHGRVGEIYDFIEPFSKKRYEKLLVKIKSNTISDLCNEFSRKEFSLESGALSYKEIYQSI